MELFAVNRYTTDDSKNQSIPVETDILQNLHQKVEKRKRDRSRVKKEYKSIADQSLSKGEYEISAPKEKQTKLEKQKAPIPNEISIEAEPTIAEKSELQTNANDKYEILGEDVNANAKKRSQKVNIVLPAWLAHPTIISTCLTDIKSTELKEQTNLSSKYPYLATHILQSLKELKVNSLFPVQTAVIPWILNAHDKPMPFRPRDICVSAPTGSGKTLAFAIPVVQLIAANRVERKIRALVVLPVVELAAQVFKVFKKLCEKTDLKVMLFSNQVSFAVEQENLIDFYKGAYYSKTDIIVTTPGRLVDHLHATKGFCLKSLQFLIIDEADRIMDAVFQNWFYHLDTHVRNTSDQLLSGRSAPLCYNELVHSAKTQPHKLLFSATLSQDPEKLQNMRLFQPKLFTSVLSDIEVLREHFTAAATAALNSVDNNNKQSKTSMELRTGEFIGKYTTPAELTEKICITESNLKPLTLHTLVKENGWNKFLCFTNSGESAERLTFVLGNLFENESIAQLSGAISHKNREKCLARFVNGEVRGLVSSDAMARGIDIDVDVVISYDPPRHIKTYIHRIGRTARAGRPGLAVTLLTLGEQKNFNKLLSEVGKHVTEEIILRTNTEEQNAERYAHVLTKLRRKIEADRNRKIWAKRNAKSMKNELAYDPAAMTLMQQLQVAVDQAMVDKAQSNPDVKEDPGRRAKKRKNKKTK